MKGGQYDDFEEEEQFNHAGLGANKRKMTKNQKIYGQFYEAYEQQTKPNKKPTYFGRSAYSNFKSGSTIQNYAAECEIDIPEPKPKKKIKQIDEQQQEEQQPVIGQFNLQSFLRDYQQKEQLQQIEQQQDQESYNGPFCLNQKIKSLLKLVKIGQEDDQEYEMSDGNMNINQMTFQQYRRLVMKNGKQQQINKKKLTHQQKQKQKQFIESYGQGYKMLQKMGFNISKGLGKQQKGIQKPVQAVFKTSFTTKDSQLKKEQEKVQEPQTQEQEIPPQTHLFQFRSRNIKVNNFILDLKNKYESLNSKIYFYQRQLQNFDRDYEINNSLKLQKQNQIQVFEQEIKKLSSVLQYGQSQNAINPVNYHHKQQINVRHIYPHLALDYKMDALYIKNQYLRLKSMEDNQFYQQFPSSVREINSFLNSFYLDKQKQTIKSYQSGIKNFINKKIEIINIDQQIIDLVDQGPTQEESVVSISNQDQQKIINFIQLIAENTLVERIDKVFSKYQHIGDIKNFKVLECLRALKNVNKNSQIVQNFIQQKIKPLLFKYYYTFEIIQETATVKKLQKLNDNQKLQNGQILPHLVIFPLFQIMNPKQLELGRLLKSISKKLWSCKSQTLYKVIKPILQYCPLSQKQNFINFYLAPRLLYTLQEFDLTQPNICKQLMSNFKVYKELLNEQILKDLLNCTIIPQIVMTYKKYENQGMPKKDLTQWIRRWSKQINKITPNHIQQTLSNDFHIQI